MWEPLEAITSMTRLLKAPQAFLTSAAVNLAMFRLTEAFKVARLLCGALFTILRSSDHN